MSESKASLELPARVLVTGATGFLGHHLCQQLRRESGVAIRALVRDPGSEAALRLPQGIELLQGDLFDDEALAAAMKEVDGVFHCAGMVSRDPADATRMNRVNVEGTKRVMEAAKAAGVRRVVHASTSGTIAVSTDSEHIATEEDPRPLELINRWPYYRGKLYAEQLALGFNGEDMEVVSVNPSLLLGPGDLHGSSTEDVVRMLEERVPAVPAGGVSFVDARDAARGMIDAMRQGKAGECYLLTACNCPVRTFFSRIARVADVPAPPISLPDHAVVRSFSKWALGRARDLLGEDAGLVDPESLELAQHYWYCESTKAENELGWRSRDPMRTLADTVDDLRERGVVMMRASGT